MFSFFIELSSSCQGFRPLVTGSGLRIHHCFFFAFVQSFCSFLQSCTLSLLPLIYFVFYFFVFPPFLFHAPSFYFNYFSFLSHFFLPHFRSFHSLFFSLFFLPFLFSSFVAIYLLLFVSFPLFPLFLFALFSFSSPRYVFALFFLSRLPLFLSFSSPLLFSAHFLLIYFCSFFSPFVFVLLP